MNDLAQGLTIDMFDGMYREIAETIGPENFVKLAELIGGATIYIPKPESLVRPVRDARIKEEFTGYNTIELARKYGVTERWVRQLCGESQTAGQYSIKDIYLDLN